MSELKVGIVSISDRASGGVYKDEGIPALKEWLAKVDRLARPAFRGKTHSGRTKTSSRRPSKNWSTMTGCHLVLTTGGTGPAPRDVTPEATLAVADKEMPGFGEQMRAVSLKYVPTAILSRQVAVIRKQALIINLPGQPKAIKETLDGVFAAVPYCIDLIGGPYIETDESLVKAFRPKSALRPKGG